MKILMCAGHENLAPGGNPVERSLTRAITPRVALHCTARGADATVVTPNPDGTVTISLQGRADKVLAINQQTQVDIFVEIHAEHNSAGDAGRGCFVVFPDSPEQNDTDTHVRDTLGPRIARAIRDMTSIPLRGNGTMSEKQTAVGLGGGRLLVFRVTRPIRATCRRLIVEVGAFSSPADLAILQQPQTSDKIGRAIAQALVPEPKTPAAWGSAVPFNRDFAIPLMWCEEQRLQRGLGRAKSPEFAHAGKTWQLFDRGAISWAEATGPEVHRPAPPEVEQAAPDVEQPAPSSGAYSEDSAIVASPGADMNRAATAILARPHGEYTEHDIREVIVPAYFELCGSVGVDPILAIAQMIHETANLASFWAARPQRNPAGIGVTGQHQLERPADTTGFAFNEQRQRWEVGLSFPTWKDHAVVAHVGRLLAFALPRGSETVAQRALIERALQFRPLPDNLRGSAPVLKRLGARHNPTGQGWANPGNDYGAKIAAIAQRIVSTSA